jgi:hypothetical protein
MPCRQCPLPTPEYFDLYVPNAANILIEALRLNLELTNRQLLTGKQKLAISAYQSQISVILAKSYPERIKVAQYFKTDQ